MARRRTRRTDTPAPVARPEPTPPPAPREAAPPPDPAPMDAPGYDGLPRLTVERVLWALVIAVAAFTRINDLAWNSLSDAEAALANAGLSLLRGDATPDPGASPLFSALAGLGMALFGASDHAARIVSALAGIVPVALTWYLRPLLGRIGALAAALIVTFSATFLILSRTASGDMLAFAGIYAALVGLYAWLQTRAPRALYAAAGGAAVALISSPIAYTALLIAALFALITLVLRARRLVDTSDWDMAYYVLRGQSGAGERAVAVFAFVCAGGATAGLLNPGGLQAAVNLAAGWLGAWGQLPARPASFALDVLLRYELLPLVFGLAGLFYMLARGDRFSLFAAWWLGASLTYYTLSPERTPAGMLLVLLPLIWIAGRAIEDLTGTLSRNFSGANEGTFILLGVITLGIMYINATSFANGGQNNNLIVVAIGAGMLVLITLMTIALSAYYEPMPLATADGAPAGSVLILRARPAWDDGLTRGYVIAGVLLLIALAAFQVRAGLVLAFEQADNPRELLVSTPTTIDARTLRPMLADISNRWDSDPTTAPVAASAAIGPALRWYLREFRSVRYAAGAIATADEPIVIVPASGAQPGFGAPYAATTMRWRWQAADLPGGASAYLRWVLFNGLRADALAGVNRVPPSYDIIVYVQQK